MILSPDFFRTTNLLAPKPQGPLCWPLDVKHKENPVYKYDVNGAFEFEARDLLQELCAQHDKQIVDDGLIKAGYQRMLIIGKEGTASLTLFLSDSFDTEFSGVALLQLGEGLEQYVFEQTHAAMVFVKEFSPMISAVLQANVIAKSV